MKQLLKKSWKTTLGGILSQLPIIWYQVETFLDGDPSTNPDWVVLMGSLSAVYAFFMARDKNVSSEDEGVK